MTGRIRPIPLKHVDRISVCRMSPLTVSPGERLQLKANTRDKDGRKLAHGELATVREILASGQIALADSRTLPVSYRQFTHGDAVTSYAAQGKIVFTVDPEQLRTNITRSGERPLAMELRPTGRRHSWFYNVIAKRFGERAADIFERARRRRKSERLRERQAQTVRRGQMEEFGRVTQVRSKSRGVGV